MQGAGAKAPALFVAAIAPPLVPNLGSLATKCPPDCFWSHLNRVRRGFPMNGIIYLVGLVVIVMAILSFIGLA
jgi:hypothetical protein